MLYCTVSGQCVFVIISIFVISVLAFQIILWCKEYLYISKWSERFHCCKVLLNAWVHRWICILPFRRLSLVWHQPFLPTLMGVLNSEISRCTWLYSSHTKKPQHNHDIIHLITPHEWKWNCLFTAANKLTFSPGCICLFKKLWLDFFYINLLSMIWRISRSPLSSNLFFYGTQLFAYLCQGTDKTCIAVMTLQCMCGIEAQCMRILHLWHNTGGQNNCYYCYIMVYMILNVLTETRCH